MLLRFTVDPGLSLVTGPMVNPGPGLVSPTGHPRLKLDREPLDLTGMPGP